MLTNHKCTLGLARVSLRHPNTFDHYRSYSTVIAEQQRQIFEGGNYVIHPLSLISLYWNSVSSILNILHMCVSTFRLSHIIDHPQSPRLHDVDILLLILHAISLLDIIFKFNTSFPEDYPVNVVIG
ncbi:unnamed protein product [Colias eurytheme]|nr:unnamed protein product [Colias eurytheme]